MPKELEVIEEMSANVDLALRENKKWSALAQLLEAYTDKSYSQGEAKLAFKAFSAYLILMTYSNGNIKLPNLGSFKLVAVPEKRGTIKTSGESKEWVSPAHSTVKFKAHDKVIELMSYESDEDYMNKVLKPLVGGSIELEE